ncbi:Fe-Mn family superoxide dismutase [Dehalobacter sp. DCM]|uniref:Fe-Mn family superoxide dismutase n=1 Tax=Dehalobacter sp. DCM TaxID=2907827 RepID=UPI003081BAB0|nr:Fe-Mn family superoxide dismutase [Dehalobacter sp. DCM]
MLAKLYHLPYANESPEPPEHYGDDGIDNRFAKRKGIRTGKSRTVQKSLEQCMIKDFGSFENFKNKFTATAVAGKGIGLTLLVWSPYFRDLEIVQATKIEELDEWGVIPILAIDIWRHEHSIQLKNKRTLGVVEWWEQVDWKNLENAFKAIVKNYI